MPTAEKSADFLLEVGTEEMPALAVRPALEQLLGRTRGLLEGQRLSHREVRTYGTPRRLAVLVEGVSARQADEVQRVRGPSERVAFGPGGEPTAAALGFARGQGVPVEELEVHDTPGGRYVFAVRTVPGRASAEVLAEAIPSLVLGLDFPKSMRWGEGRVRFVRPIRWVVALFGDRVLPARVGDGPTVTAGAESRGHRFLCPGPVRISAPSDYVRALRRAHVLVDHEERKALVLRQVEAAAAAAGGEALVDDQLLEEVAFLVEWPTAFAGRFDDAFLDLPPDVLFTTMREHQRYFPVVDGDGRPLAAFVGVRNGGSDGIEVVARGNERVLRARLADARFFYEEDKKTPLADRVEGLRAVLFQERLGSLLDKVSRVRTLAAKLAPAMGLSEEEAARADRAAFLSKADLVTAMVREFPELQGVMGREYALASGEDPAVARAVFEHYLPRHAGDRLPESLEGVVVALADRLDTLAGVFGAGLQPTGSNDPYAVRRQALGVIAILRARGLSLSLGGLVRSALEGYTGLEGFGPAARERAAEGLVDFLKGRLRTIMQEEGVRYDVVDAVLAQGEDRVPVLLGRAKALMALLESPALEDVMTVYRRAAHLSSGVGEQEAPREELMEEPAEVELHRLSSAVRAEAGRLLEAGEYVSYFSRVASLRPAVDRFFEAVLVMADDPRVRANRLALLRGVSRLLLDVADFGRLAVG